MENQSVGREEIVSTASMVGAAQSTVGTEFGHDDRQALAAVLVGHGSLHSDSGKSMIRIAARLREQAVVPIVEAGFLNYNQPTLADAVQKALDQGANSIIIQPYFLIDGQYASQDLPRLVHMVADKFPGVAFAIAETLGYHHALVALTQKRIAAVDATPTAMSALLLVAHGTPLEQANAPIHRISREVGAAMGYGAATVAFLDCNQPTIPEAIAKLCDDGYQRIVIQPYFLHLGRHVRTDLPALFATARAAHPTVDILVTHHLDYDLRLITVASERIVASVSR